jgi:hypothetical protein
MGARGQGALVRKGRARGKVHFIRIPVGGQFMFSVFGFRFFQTTGH